MITQLKPAKAIRTEFVAADIENTSSGAVIAIDTYDGETHTPHKDWGKWLAWIADRAITDKRYRTVYAHNGGGWDWLSFVEWVLACAPDLIANDYQGGRYLHAIDVNGQIIAVIVPLSNGQTIRLMDSIRLWGNPPTPLHDAAMKYIGRGKLPMQHLPEWYWKHDRKRFWRYLYNDTEILYETLVRFAHLVYEQIAPIPKLGMTLPSTALRCFQTAYLPFPVAVPSDTDVRNALRKAYAGGRVEVFQPGYYKQIYVYDVNSLYPSVMAATPVPITGAVTWTRKLKLDTCGVYRVRFTQCDTNKRPVLMVGGVGAYQGEGWYFTNELRRLVRMARGKVKVIEGFVFDDSAVLFKDYVERLYRLRMTDPKGPLGNTCKLFLNSLYGKFGQRPERSCICKLDTDTAMEWIDAGVGVEIINEQLGIFRVMEERETPFEHVGIAGTITSEARAVLWEGFNAGTVYCDTDSVHTTQPLPQSKIGTGLGRFKIEFQGKAVYVGKKLYALENKDVTKIRAKGIRVKRKPDDFGCRLDFAGLRSLLDGATIACKFRSAATLNRVLRGGKACTFDPKAEPAVMRQRTIRKTA